VQLMTTWRAAALAGALLWGACSKEPAPAPAPAPEPKPEAQAPAPEPVAEPEPEPEEPPTTAEAPPPVEDTGEPPEFKIGQSRAEVMHLFGNCAERKVFLPPAPGALYVEIYQPKEDEACRKRLGERQFTIRGDVLHQITPGLIPEPSGTYEPPPDGV
jgi:hypothetical protein